MVTASSVIPDRECPVSSYKDVRNTSRQAGLDRLFKTIIRMEADGKRTGMYSQRVLKSLCKPVVVVSCNNSVPSVPSVPSVVAKPVT